MRLSVDLYSFAKEGEALSTGAGGYVVKSEAASDLSPAVKALLEGKRFVSASLADRGANACEAVRRNIPDGEPSPAHGR